MNGEWSRRSQEFGRRKTLPRRLSTSQRILSAALQYHQRATTTCVNYIAWLRHVKQNITAKLYKRVRLYGEPRNLAVARRNAMTRCKRS